MPHEELPQGKIVREYILKFPTLSKRAIAQKLYEDFPIYFTSAERARYMVRSKTGNAGKRNRKYMHTVKYVGHFSTQNPRGIPPKGKKKKSKKK